MVASSSMAPKPKRKDTRVGRIRIRTEHYLARRAQTERQKQARLRKAQCENAGVPYKKHIRLAKATERPTEQPCEPTVPSHLYILRRSDAPHIFKIGRSRDPALCAKQLGEAHCFKVECLMSFDQAGVHEREVHMKLDEYRVVGGQGREWFEAPLELITKTIHEVLGRYE